MRSFSAIFSFHSILIALFSLCGPAKGQDLLAELKIDGLYGQLGNEVGALGDVNGDQIGDLLASSYEVGGVFVYSGMDGSLIHYVDLKPDFARRIAGIGDVNGDGIPDWAAGITDRTQTMSRICVLSGQDSSEIWSLTGKSGDKLGWSLAALGDVNNDGAPDLAAGAPDADVGNMESAGMIMVLSGKDGKLINKITGAQSEARLGLRMGPFNDLDGDGRNDLIVNDPDYDLSDSAEGMVAVLSAYTGDLLLDIYGPIMSDTDFGRTAADAGDLDGDGLSDIAVSMATSSNLVWVATYSSATEKLIWMASVEAVYSLLSPGDIDGDNIPDLVAGGPSYSGHYPNLGTLDLIDGAKGNVVHTFQGSTYGSFMSLASPGDLDGDGWPDLFSGSDPEYINSEGIVVAHSLRKDSMLYTITNNPGGDHLGAAVGLAGDLDQDGVNDCIVASYSRLVVFSGATEEILLDVETDDKSGYSSTPVMGHDDINGDGVPDIATGNPYHGSDSAGRLQIISGKSGYVLKSIEGNGHEYLGGELAPTIDRNGDGIDDLYVSLDGKELAYMKSAGEVRLLDGATLETLEVYNTTPQQYGAFGLSLSAGGDLDGDSIPDLAVGSCMDVPPGSSSGALYLLSGATGAQIRRIDGDPSSNQVEGAIIGDADGDGVPDVVSVEWLWSAPGDPYLESRGRVRVWSGSTETLLWTAAGATENTELGRYFGEAGDVNGDGYADLAVSASEGVAAGRALFLSGLDGNVLDELDLPSGATAFASVGHYDKGGSSDVFIGMALFEKNGAARIYASSQGGVHGFKDLGHGLAGTDGNTPLLKGYGDLAVGEQVSLKVSHVLPLASGYWFLSLARADLVFKGGILVPDPFQFFFAFPVNVNGNGEFVYMMTNPPGIPSGLSLFHQFWFLDPLGPQNASATNGLEEIFK